MLLSILWVTLAVTGTVQCIDLSQYAFTDVS